MVCLALAGGYRLYFSPTSIISIDINPSIELSVNRFDKVVAVEGLNEDGVTFAETLDVLYHDYQEAVEEIMASDTIADCLAREELLSVAVVEIDQIQGEAILEYVSQCTAQKENTYCCGVTPDEVKKLILWGCPMGNIRYLRKFSNTPRNFPPRRRTI